MTGDWSCDRCGLGKRPLRSFGVAAGVSVWDSQYIYIYIFIHIIYIHVSMNVWICHCLCHLGLKLLNRGYTSLIEVGVTDTNAVISSFMSFPTLVPIP